MTIFYPDNDKRTERVLELGTDAQSFLYQSTLDYGTFTTLMSTVNQQLADVYKQSGLQPPSVTTVNILQQAGVPSDVDRGLSDLKIAEIIADAALFISMTKYFAPAVTRSLVRVGAMSTETAAKVLIDVTIPVVGRDITLTVGDIAGSVIGGVLSGIAVAGLDFGIDAIEGAIARNKLRTALHQICPLRTSTKLSQNQTGILVQSITAVKTTLDAISGAGIPLTDALIKNLIQRDVAPAVAKSQAITNATTLAELAQFDSARSSWTAEDAN